MSERKQARGDQREQFQHWYARNKDERNRKRREKYQKDPEYRKKAIELSRRARRSGRHLPQQPKVHVVDGAPMQVYRIGAAAAQIGRYPKRIAEWEARGWIPKPTIESGHRMYTSRQVMLMKRIADALEFRGTRAEKQAHLERVVEQVRENW